MTDTWNTVLKALQRDIGTCRELLPNGETCGGNIEFILWGKLLPVEARGPRCYDCAARHVGAQALGDRSWAIISLGQLAKAAAASAHNEDPINDVLFAMRWEIGGCREEQDVDKCWKPADVVLWGKTLPAEAMGPRCGDCAHKHIGAREINDLDETLISLRRLAKVAVAAANSQPAA